MPAEVQSEIKSDVKLNTLIRTKTYDTVLGEANEIYSTAQAKTAERLNGIVNGAGKPLSEQIDVVGRKYQEKLKAIHQTVRQALETLANSDDFNGAAHRNPQGMSNCVQRLTAIHDNAQEALAKKHRTEQTEFNRIFDGLTLKDAEGKEVDRTDKQSAEFEELLKRQNDEKAKLTEALNLVGHQINDAYFNANLNRIAITCANHEKEQAYALEAPVHHGSFLGTPYGVAPEAYAPKEKDFKNNVRGSRWTQFVNTTVNSGNLSLKSLSDKSGLFTSVYITSPQSRFVSGQGFWGNAFATLLREGQSFGVTHKLETIDGTKRITSTVSIPPDASVSATIAAFQNYFSQLIAMRHDKDPSQPAFSVFDVTGIRRNHGEAIALKVAEHIISLTGNPNCVRGFADSNAKFTAIKTRAGILHGEWLTKNGLEGANSELAFQEFQAPGTTPAANVTGSMTARSSLLSSASAGVTSTASTTPAPTPTSVIKPPGSSS